MCERQEIKSDSSIDQSKLLDLYWNHFELHSNQRMQMINFYITIEVVLIGGFFTLRLQNTDIIWAEYLVALAIPFVSLIFFLLDYRTRALIKVCEACIKKLEDMLKEDFNEELMLYHQAEKKASKKWFRNTYSRVFWLQFLVVSLVGFLLLYSIIK